jgi:hypothetical protein
MSRARRALCAAIVGALLALVPLSVPIAKEPLYMVPVVPFLYVLVALSLVAPDRTPARYERINRGAAQVSIVFAAGLMAFWLLSGLWRAAPALPIALALLQIAIWSVPSVCVLRGRSVAPAILPCVLASLALTAVGALTSPLGTI